MSLIVCSVSLVSHNLTCSRPSRLSLCVRACTDNESRRVDLSSLDTSAAVETIVSDQIDILVDLTGNTAGNRLDVFAASPAPIQVPCASIVFGISAGFASEAACDTCGHAGKHPSDIPSLCASFHYPSR
jgi:hypothetical protein